MKKTKKPRRTPPPVASTPRARPPRRNFEVISQEAANILAGYRKELEAELQRRYLERKWAEVKRLAAEEGIKLPIMDITTSELVQLRVKKP